MLCDETAKKHARQMSFFCEERLCGNFIVEWPGVYTVRKTPDEWPSIESLLDNMYRNMLRRDIELKGHEHAGEERLPVVSPNSCN